MRRVLFPLCLPLVACGVAKISGDEGGACVPEPVQSAFTAHCANMPACHGDSPTTQVAINLTPAGSSALPTAAPATARARVAMVEVRCEG